MMKRFGKGLICFWRACLSVPIFFKVLGIGVLVAFVFGGVTLTVLRMGTVGIHRAMLERRAMANTDNLARELSRAMSTGDLLRVQDQIDAAKNEYPDIRFIVAWDAHGRVVAHTFDGAVPDDLLGLHTVPSESKPNVRVLGTPEGLVFDVDVPILGGNAGRLQLGVTDRVLRQQIAILTRLVLGALSLSAVIGVTLALLLTNALTRPLNHLRHMAEQIRQGNFSSRAQIYNADEVGQLSETFNEMAESLATYEAKVKEKEAARVSLLKQLVRVQEEERAHVARELHDQLGQLLTKILFSFQTARQDCFRCGDHCAGLEQEMRYAVDETRRLAWNIRPPLLDDYGLSSALERYLNDMSAHYGIAVSFESVAPEDAPRLSAETEIALYRIAQEAMTNIARHAHASRVDVLLMQRESRVSLMVEDNGRGFDTSALREGPGSSLGIVGMRERAALVGGTLDVESEPGSGTEVIVTVPMETDEHDH